MADRTARSHRLDQPTPKGAHGGPSGSRGGSADQLTHSMWEREMRRLRVTTRILAALLLALCARGVLAGINAAIGLTAAIVAGLLVVSLILTRQGQRLEPASRRGVRDRGQVTGRVK